MGAVESNAVPSTEAGVAGRSIELAMGVGSIVVDPTEAVASSSVGVGLLESDDRGVPEGEGDGVDNGSGDGVTGDGEAADLDGDGVGDGVGNDVMGGEGVNGDGVKSGAIGDGVKGDGVGKDAKSGDNLRELCVESLAANAETRRMQWLLASAMM